LEHATAEWGRQESKQEKHKMRSRLFLSSIAAAALVAGAAQAGPLTSATWTQALQGVDVTVTNSGSTCTSTGANIINQTITCSTGSGLNPSGTASATDYSVSLTLPAFALNQFTTGGAININTMASIPTGTQSITGNNSAAAADAGLPGMVTVKVAIHAAKGVNASNLTAGPTTLVKVPLSIGKAGTFTDYFYVLANIHYITVDFYAWTPHTLTFSGLTSKFAPLPTPTVVAMGSFNLNGAGGGTVTLVSPSKISIDGPLAQRRTASFTALKLTYAAPEPSTLLLLGAGVAGLVLIGSRKR
jgi:hypothetical protein